MKKLLVASVTSLFLLNAAAVANAENNENVTAEKAWTIELNAKALNTPKNLEKIVLKTADGVQIDAEVRVNSTNPSQIEVLPAELLKEESYEVTVEEGFESVNKLKTADAYTETFTVASAMQTEDLKGTWETNYTHEDVPYNIVSTYNNGTADLVVRGADFTLAGPETYSLKDGYMKMEIKSFGVQLNGAVKIFDGNKFLVTSASGKEAIFKRIK